MAGTKVHTQDSGNRLFLPPCRVCGDKAAGFHYGVNTCEACKGFFHRSLRRYKDYKCRASRSSGFCDYKPGKRKSCQYCRYQRCLNAGMAKEAIKTGRYTYLKRTEDTQEIQRLQNMEHHVQTDEPDKETAVVSSSLSSLTFLKNQSPKRTRNQPPDICMGVDSTTTDVFTGSASDKNQSCSSSDFFYTNADIPGPTIILESLRQNSIDRTNSTFCQSNQTQLIKSVPFCSNKTLINNLKKSDHTQIKEQMISVKVDYSNTPGPQGDQSDSFSHLCSSDSELTPPEENESSYLESQKSCQALEPARDVRSVIYRLLSNTNIKHNIELAKKCLNDKVMMFSNKQSENKNFELQTEADVAMQSPGYSVFETKLSVCDNPASVSSNKASDKGKDVTFDLFPDISFCLDGRPVSSPVSVMSDEVGTSSVLTPSGLLSSLTSPSVDNSVSPVPSPGAVLFNLDSGRHLKVDGDHSVDRDLSQTPVDRDLCQTPESNFPAKDETLDFEDDNVTLQIMEEYTQGLDLIIDSSTATQVPTPVEALLTSASLHDMNSRKPVSPCGSDKDYISESSPTLKLTSRVKELHLRDIPELFGDMDTVISMLVASHRENIGDFSYMSKEEMFAQQKAHCESCHLQQQTFGELAFLPEHEYDDIYSVTGIDIDNRRTIIQKYLARMEKCVRGLVHFAKAIPGFSMLDMYTQVELIKLARSEVAIFTIYPTVNLSLGVSLGLGGESWACLLDIRKWGSQEIIEDYMIFCDKLQKMALNEEEEVLLKAILVMSTDRDSYVTSPLAEAIRWQLILCLKHSLEKHRETPSLLLARYMLVLTQSRTVSEKFKDFIRELKMHKYSSIQQNPLMWELYSGILQEKEGRVNLSTFCQLVTEGKVGLWSPCFLGDPLNG